MEISANKFLKDFGSLSKSFYLVGGEENYAIDSVVHKIRNYLKRSNYTNFTIKNFFAKDTSLKEVIDLANTIPMLSDKQLFFIKDIQDNQSFFTQDLTESTEKFFSKKHPISTIIFIHNGALDKRINFYKLLKENGTIINCSKISDREATSEVKSYLVKNKATITPSALYLIKSLVNGDLRLIYAEIDKILWNKIDTINEGVVEKYCSDNKRYTIFQLQDAIVEKNYGLALQVISNSLMQDKVGGLISLLSVLHAFFSKVLGYHHLKKKSESEVSKQLQIPSYYFDKYIFASRNFAPKKIKELLEEIHQVDLCIKGIKHTALSQCDLADGLIMKLLSE